MDRPPPNTDGAPRRRRMAMRLCGLSAAAYAFWVVNFGGGLVQSLGGTHPTASGVTLLFLLVCLIGLGGFASATWRLAAGLPGASRLARLVASFDLCVQGVLYVPRSGAPLLLLLSLAWVVVDVLIIRFVGAERNASTVRSGPMR